MRRLTLFASFVAGAALGVIGLLVLSKSNGLSTLLSGTRGDDAPSAELEHLATKELASVLMRRVAEGFVADTRAAGVPIKYGVAFFDIPKPSGQWLCSVNEYEVPPKIVRGRQIKRE